jgi:hypothetical protein
MLVENKIRGRFSYHLHGPDKELSQDVVCTSLALNVAQFAIIVKGWPFFVKWTPRINSLTF